MTGYEPQIRAFEKEKKMIVFIITRNSEIRIVKAETLEEGLNHLGNHLQYGTISEKLYKMVSDSKTTVCVQLNPYYKNEHCSI